MQKFKRVMRKNVVITTENIVIYSTNLCNIEILYKYS